MRVRQMNGVGGLMLDLHTIQPGAVTNADFGDAVGEIAAFADVGFNQRGGGARCNFNYIRGGDGARWRIGGNENQFHRRVDDARQDQPRAIGSESQVHLLHGLGGDGAGFDCTVQQFRALAVIVTIDEDHAGTREFREGR
jgi:hypothetical protein